MTRSRRLALAAAACYLVTWVTSVAAVPLYGGSAFDPHARLAGRASVVTASLLEVALAIAVVGTSLALYPLLRRHGPGAALGYVALRTLEATVILTGVVVILPAVARPTVTTPSGLDAGVVDGLHLMHDWAFLVGPGLVNPVNAVVLATLLLRARLVPRFIPLLGITGAAMVFTMNVLGALGLTAPVPVVAVPLFLWEICLASYLALRGIPATAEAAGTPTTGPTAAVSYPDSASLSAT